MRAALLAEFMVAREQRRIMNQVAADKHSVAWVKNNWIKDEILDTYRFCNVRREDDRVTKWIKENWRDPHDGDPHMWFAMIVARLFNNPATLAEIGWPVPWAPKQVARKLHAMKARGEKVFNAAYIVSTNGRAMDKVEYLVGHVLDPIWQRRKEVTNPILKMQTLAEIHAHLMTLPGLASFMAAQVVADLKHTYPWYDGSGGDLALCLPTSQVSDWYTFAASGPGSRRGLNRVMMYPVDQGWREAVWRATLAELHKAVLRHLPVTIGAKLHAQDLQNCLCEFDKYLRAKEDGGRPKQLYVPYTEEK